LRLPVAAHLGRPTPHRREGGVISLEHMAGSGGSGGPQPAAYFVAHSQVPGRLDPRRAGLGVTRLGDRRPHRPERWRRRTWPSSRPWCCTRPLAHLGDAPCSRAPRWRTCPRLRNVVRQVASLLRRSNWPRRRLHGVPPLPAGAGPLRARVQARRGLVAAGTDAANQLLIPGEALHEELALLVAAGLTPSRRSRQPRATAPSCCTPTRSPHRPNPPTSSCSTPTRLGWGGRGGRGGHRRHT